MKILIVGAGAIGSLFGGLLAKKETVWLVGRKDHVSAIEDSGLRIFSDGREVLTHPKTSVRIPTDKDFDCIVVTTKAFDMEKAAKDLQTANLNGIPIIILQNGYGNEALTKKILPNSIIMRAITTEGAYCPAMGQVVRAGIGRTYIGFSKSSEFRQDLLQQLSSALSFSGFPTTVTDEIKLWVWGKLLVNAIINPICSLANCRNGYILENPNLRGLSRKLAKELMKLTRTLKLKLPFDDLQIEVERVLHETSSNQCSMLQDVMAKKRTEIEFLNGAVSDLAKTHGIDTPINDALTNLILGRQKIHLKDSGG